ncbi:hypothetical protein TTHERM_00580370 (macronuclear) [Tetrahymena thermophila SB210]|uniref:Uncharacterized protein n=1 Tax=Tetrahymena thermophila (strain SB210) TaxID=312017 RepID=I7MH84_TETTS|nr:hypothetical protein TTHERM_00580370 [Tetrahymena thermophila SB210]EAS02694.1 hypothetical protein TTHERM_00580370 [Tetrahymena thermophila SB210]|eukprot:XP_001022939.1 hypothetical protein TTHERM_00580370 [Tetrahymena thermophila SB210]
MESKNLSNKFNKNQITQLLNETLPVYMQFELKYNRKPVTVGTNFTFDKVNQKIQQRFPTIKIKVDLITQKKLDKIYEGIVEIIKSGKETAMIFKNVVDVEFVKIYFHPYDLKEASLIQTKNNINIIMLVFNQE